MAEPQRGCLDHIHLSGFYQGRWKPPSNRFPFSTQSDRVFSFLTAFSPVSLVPPSPLLSAAALSCMSEMKTLGEPLCSHLHPAASGPGCPGLPGTEFLTRPGIFNAEMRADSANQVEYLTSSILIFFLSLTTHYLEDSVFGSKAHQACLRGSL